MNTQNIVVSGIVAAVVGLLVTLVVSPEAPVVNNIVPSDDPQFGQILTVPDHYPNGVGLGGMIENYGSFEVGTGDDSHGWRNVTGKTIYVDLVTVTTNGTASTTFSIDVATSTTQNITSGSNPFSEFIDSYSLATSTPAITINSIENGGTNGISVVPVEDGEWISLLLDDTDGGEAPTSLNRGFTKLTTQFRYFYPTD